MKRDRAPDDGDTRVSASAAPPPKRTRTTGSADRLSRLSDELLVRILGHLSLPGLLAVAPVSRRFLRLADDAQLWKALYYGRPPDWKRQYKLRHNWDRGQCAVEELLLDADEEDRHEADEEEADEAGQGEIDVAKRRMRVQVVDGLAVTANRRRGLQVWDLRTRSLLAGARLDTTPSALSVRSVLSVRSAVPASSGLDLALGHHDGGFAIWRLDRPTRTLHCRFAHAASSNGSLMAVAYAHPLLLTATDSVMVSLYAWGEGEEDVEGTSSSSTLSSSSSPSTLPPPTLLTALRSHTSQPPLALSIRRLPSTTIASIAYTFATRQGWAIGIQDLHVQPAGPSALPRITTTRLAFSAPVTAHRVSDAQAADSWSTSTSSPPTRLCYTHPYLLATLPDNTLVLFLCTSSAAALALAPGIRLWGHTSGISDAEITARGKAVSVSVRGDEMRVWQLEGRPAAARGRSVAVRPCVEEAATTTVTTTTTARRNWVGFDDERVLVLNESHGRESLLVYDFT